jgi:hypothetical protein
MKTVALLLAGLAFVALLGFGMTERSLSRECSAGFRASRPCT